MGVLAAMGAIEFTRVRESDRDTRACLQSPKFDGRGEAFVPRFMAQT